MSRRRAGEIERERIWKCPTVECGRGQGVSSVVFEGGAKMTTVVGWWSNRLVVVVARRKRNAQPLEREEGVGESRVLEGNPENKKSCIGVTWSKTKKGVLVSGESVGWGDSREELSELFVIVFRECANMRRSP